jgi:hypothetical protein
MNGSAELYLAYDFQNLRVRRYEKPNQPPITLEFYDMASSENAYGVFSFERQDEAAGIGQGFKPRKESCWNQLIFINPGRCLHRPRSLKNPGLPPLWRDR